MAAGARATGEHDPGGALVPQSCRPPLGMPLGRWRAAKDRWWWREVVIMTSHTRFDAILSKQLMNFNAVGDRAIA